MNQRNGEKCRPTRKTKKMHPTTLVSESDVFSGFFSDEPTTADVRIFGADNSASHIGVAEQIRKIKARVSNIKENPTKIVLQFCSRTKFLLGVNGCVWTIGKQKIQTILIDLTLYCEHS